MKYLLDTNICIYLIKQNPPNVVKKFSQHDITEIGISTITIAELEFGVFKSKYQNQNKEALEKFLLFFDVIPFDKISAQVYGYLRCELEKRGTPIGAMDMLIAAQALDKGLVVVTNNSKEFSKVPNLKIENWI